MENLYLISGDDEYEKNRYVEKIKKQFGTLSKGINYVQIDKDNIDMLEQELSTYSFFGGDKLVIVKVPKKSSQDDEASQLTKKDWLNDEIEELIKTKPDSIWLVFIEDGTSKSKLFKLVNEYGKCFDLEKDKPYELSRWVKENFESHNAKIASNDVEYLVELCGNDKITLNNEIDKLINFIGNDGIVDKPAIDKMCIKTSEIIIFDLTDAIAKKNTRLALDYLEEMLDNKEPLQKIMIMITKNFKSLLLTKVALSQKKDVAKELNIKPYPAKKYSEQSRNFTMDELINILKELAKLDVDSKNGKIDLKVGLQKIICM